jgi:hypothetical protein
VGREQRRNAVQSRAGQQAHTPALAIDGDTPLSSLRSSRVPGAAAIPVKLCPAPTALSARPRAPAERTERRTASIVVGYSTSCGRTLSVRAQFCHVPPGRVTGSSSLRRGRWRPRRRGSRRG